MATYLYDFWGSTCFNRCSISRYGIIHSDSKFKLAASYGAVEVTVTECVVLTITKKCCPHNPEPGDRVRFKISVMNSGAVPVYNVMVTDILPSCVSFKGTNKNNGWTITVHEDVTAQIPLIGAGQTSSFTICGTLGCCFCNQLFNIASVTAESITQPGVAACALKKYKV